MMRASVWFVITFVGLRTPPLCRQDMATPQPQSPRPPASDPKPAASATSQATLVVLCDLAVTAAIKQGASWFSYWDTHDLDPSSSSFSHWSTTWDC